MYWLITPIKPNCVILGISNMKMNMGRFARAYNPNITASIIGTPTQYFVFFFIINELVWLQKFWMEKNITNWLMCIALAFY